ncbi:hypothetical protein ACFWPP_00095 [Streptomyces anulatus]|uniref:hypothetical protein n=1 Tax=Streptomyces anulatus TaxID=1892 RepID=UPI003657B813
MLAEAAAATVESLVTARVSAGPSAPGARWVLEPRPARTDITLAHRTKTIAWSFAWLEHYADGTAGTFAVRGAEELLGPLLSLELDAAQVRRLRLAGSVKIRHSGMSAGKCA